MAFIEVVHVIAPASFEQAMSMTYDGRALVRSLQLHFAVIYLASRDITPASGSWQLASSMPTPSRLSGPLSM